MGSFKKGFMRVVTRGWFFCEGFIRDGVLGFFHMGVLSHVVLS